MQRQENAAENQRRVGFLFFCLDSIVGQLRGVGLPGDAISKAAKLTLHCVFCRRCGFCYWVSFKSAAVRR